MLTDIALCSRALIGIGCEPITSFGDGTAEADVAALLYGGTRDALIASYPWSFASGQIELAPITAAPVADFDYAFQIPEDFLRALSVGTPALKSGSGVEYRIKERRIHCDAAAIVLSYIFRPDEIACPPSFDDALIARLAAEFCMPLTASLTAAQEAERKAAGKFATARLIDAQQQTPNAFQDFTLLRVR